MSDKDSNNYLCYMRYAPVLLPCFVTIVGTKQAVVITRIVLNRVDDKIMMKIFGKDEWFEYTPDKVLFNNGAIPN